jgi:hypothetical protein
MDRSCERMDVIDEFLRSYAREIDFYQEAARLSGQACELQLRAAGKRAIVTYRAKNPQRLGDKLRKRDHERHYTDAQAITDDIIDLAGVRVALYFPTDQKDIDRIIKSLFTLAREPKTFPDRTATTTGDYQKQFSGLPRHTLPRSSQSRCAWGRPTTLHQCPHRNTGRQRPHARMGRSRTRPELQTAQRQPLNRRASNLLPRFSAPFFEKCGDHDRNQAPSRDRAIQIIAEKLISLCRGDRYNGEYWSPERQGRWLVREACNRWFQWEGPAGLRAVFSSRFRPPPSDTTHTERSSPKSKGQQASFFDEIR